MSPARSRKWVNILQPHGRTHVALPRVQLQSMQMTRPAEVAGVNYLVLWLRMLTPVEVHQCDSDVTCAPGGCCTALLQGAASTYHASAVAQELPNTAVTHVSYAFQSSWVGVCNGTNNAYSQQCYSGRCMHEGRCTL